ncbi:Hsp20/alpha crystallin family protein [Streptomyces mexicanus]|jgi:HSP20 family protein|uniref:Hsp20/alpha crystallin family protein n=1 Tax=Streptomyces mexicanus TaxID=178566 RepID=A0A7X1I4G8_9ACTN|nr:Hsp20/alpha crystallin family protein [Streptomyces mexicanus]MBC2868577.1 Hsp20/alpha crystallin family protein [Streptomyces mexicanus]
MALPVRREHNRPVWDPFKEFQDLYDRMGQLWQSAVPGGGGLIPDAWTPLADLEETDDAYLVEVDLPGVKKDDITVELNAGELSVHGEIKEKERTGVLRHRTRRTGQFDYRVTLPQDTDEEQVSAELVDGVLTVKVPKAQKAKPRRIEITS